MARLFITPREQQLIADLTKEVIKDVIGQYITLYPVSTLKTQVHDVYDEAVEKIFDHPIKIDCLVGQPERSQTIGRFSLDRSTTIEVLIQARDLVDKNFDPVEGDFFVYGNEVFEIMNTTEMGDIFGQAEHNVYWKLIGKTVRSGRFDLDSFRKFLEDRKDYKKSNIQKVFEQQRGLPETDVNGATGDVRQVRDRLAADMAPIALNEGPRQVNAEDTDDVSDTTGDNSASSFYNE
jgi:hypothetical protein